MSYSSSRFIVIIDYAMGNVESVSSALDYLDCPHLVTGDLATIRKADRYILPGVGAFPKAMFNLKRLGLLDELVEQLTMNSKFCLGICLGMQVMAAVSQEFGETKGMGIFDSVVKELDKTKVRVPHVGWNTVIYSDGSPLFKGIEQNSYFYFDHSYHLSSIPPENTIATTDYGHQLAVAIKDRRIYGVQFHPEKSQRNGIKLLRNYISLR